MIDAIALNVIIAVVFFVAGLLFRGARMDSTTLTSSQLIPSAEVVRRLRTQDVAGRLMRDYDHAGKSK